MGAARGVRSGTTSGSNPGINAWTAREAGDRLINEHDEADAGTTRRSSTSSRTGGPVSSSTASRWMRPPDLRHVQPGVKRTAFAEEPATTVLAMGATLRKAVRGRRLGGLGADQSALRSRTVRGGGGPRARGPRGASRVRRAGLQPRVLREPGRLARGRVEHSAARSRRGGRVRESWPSRTRTSTRSATSPASRNSSGESEPGTGPEGLEPSTPVRQDGYYPYFPERRPGLLRLGKRIANISLY